jgi:glycerol-3-phosphate acyltransferase PlsY
MIDNPIILLAVFPLIAYLIGATPFGMIIGVHKGVDLRLHGSGNVGATNVGRVLGRRWGYLCFFLDVAKGLIPVALAGAVLRPAEGVPTLLHQAAWLGVGLGAILGHVFTFWLGFKGGKGVATALGVVLGFSPYFTGSGLIALAIWIAVTLASRYVSLGSVVAAAAFLPTFVAFNYGRLAEIWPFCAFAAAMVVLVIVRHRSNIRRLLTGTENKVTRPWRAANDRPGAP